MKKLLTPALSLALLASSVAVVGAGSATVASAASGSSCDASALKSAKSPVHITYWESTAGANLTAMKALVAAYNKSQKKVVVSDVNQTGGYIDTWNAYTLSGGTGANVFIDDVTNTQAHVDSKLTIPIQDCFASAKFSTKNYLQKALSQQKLGGKVQALPYSASTPVLYYNLQAFAKAHIAKAPTTIDEMTADAHKLTQVGYTDGMSIKNDPWWLELWSAMGKDYYVNNQNGRSGRATAVAFDTDRNRSLLTKLQNMVKNSDAKSYSATGAGLGAFNNLFAMSSDKSGMTIDTSAALGTIAGYLPLFKNITIGVAPLPRLTANDNGGLMPGGNGLSISSKNSALENAAAFDFVKFLSAAKNLASWDVSTGYVPITSDAAKDKQITNLWKAKPYYKVAYDQINTGGASNATEGPAIGNYYAVNTQVANALNQILTNTSSDVATALGNARDNANSAISSYNSSL